MYDLEYTKPENIKSAVIDFDKSNDGKYLAGGMTLIPTLKSRLSSPDVLIDLKSADRKSVV